MGDAVKFGKLGYPIAVGFVVGALIVMAVAPVGSVISNSARDWGIVAALLAIALKDEDRR